MNEDLAMLQLVQTRGLGARTLTRLLQQLAQEQVTAAELVAVPVPELVEHYGLRPRVAGAIPAARFEAERLLETLRQKEIRWLVRGTPDYPPLLARVLGDQAPPVLFVAGAIHMLHEPTVAFAGVREASEGGLSLTQGWASLLTKKGLVLVSGYAPGVDLMCHQAALSAGGQTAFVLAEGILRFRPRAEIAPLLNERNAVIISEFAPEAPWSAGLAMTRNRTICGLARALVIIEAAAKGGSLASGRNALKLGVPLLVTRHADAGAMLPGNILLLEEGAIPLDADCPDDSVLARVQQIIDGINPEAC